MVDVRGTALLLAGGAAGMQQLVLGLGPVGAVCRLATFVPSRPRRCATTERIAGTTPADAILQLVAVKPAWPRTRRCRDRRPALGAEHARRRRSVAGGATDLPGQRR
jgi:hypothetical protein